jgi:hypothetical protein
MLSKMYSNIPIMVACDFRLSYFYVCLLTDWDEINNLYRGPSIDDSYQVSVQLAKQFQGRRFLKIDQSETRIACGSHVC